MARQECYSGAYRRETGPRILLTRNAQARYCVNGIARWGTGMRSIEEILRECKTVAVVGLSPNPARPSHGVAVYLQAQGYRIVPVNPMVEELLGERSYPDLEAIPFPVELIDVFRRSEEVPAIAEQAIRVGAPTLWLQLGVIHHEAAARAAVHGIDVVMDRCTAIEHRALVRQGKL